MFVLVCRAAPSAHLTLPRPRFRWDVGGVGPLRNGGFDSGTGCIGRQTRFKRCFGLLILWIFVRGCSPLRPLSWAPYPKCPSCYHLWRLPLDCCVCVAGQEKQRGGRVCFFFFFRFFCSIFATRFFCSFVIQIDRLIV